MLGFCQRKVLHLSTFRLTKLTGENGKFGSFASRTTLGMVIDDPRNDKELAAKIVFHFEQAQVANFMREYRPRTTFTASMNIPCLQRLASDPMLITRVVLIPFVTPAYSRTPIEQDQPDSVLAASIENARKGAGVVVRLGHSLLSSLEDFQGIMSRVAL